MPEMKENFNTLLGVYSSVFTTSHHVATTVSGLRKTVPRKVTGVYIVEETGDDPRILYIGSAGKIHKGMTTSGSSIHSRMFGSSTPYRFDPAFNTFRYGPTTSGVPPAGYSMSFNVKDIKVTCITVPCPKAPSVLEHLLLQGHINQFGDLPNANQKI